MKKLLFFVSLSILITVTGCTDNELADALYDDPVNTGGKVSINVNMPNSGNVLKSGTRIALDQENMSLDNEGVNINLGWQTGDQLHFCFIDGTNSSIKVWQEATVKSVSEDGKNAVFEISIPANITSSTFNLYGIYGGGGIDPGNPSRVILPSPGEATANSLNSLQQNGVVMLKSEQTGISKTTPVITLNLEHVGSVFSIRLNNNTDDPLAGVKTARLTAGSSIGARASSENSSFDLVTGIFTGTTIGNTLAFNLPGAVDVPAGEHVEFWGWFPVADNDWPAMNLELLNTEGTVMHGTTVPTTERTAESGRAYHIVAAYSDDGTGLRFARISQEVHVATPGTLAGLLFYDRDNLLRVKITGELDEEDFTFMKDHLKNMQWLDMEGIANTELPAALFKDNETIKEVALPSGLEAIPDDFFNYARGLVGCDIPSTVTSIGLRAFRYTRFNHLTLPGRLETIGSYAFQLGAFISFEIPASVTSIGEGAFIGANNGSLLVAVNVDPANSKYTSVDGVVFSKDMTEIHVFPGMKVAEEYVIPEGVKKIMPSAFRVTRKIDAVSLPSTLESIGANAFSNSTIKKITSKAETPPTIENLNAFNNVPVNIEIEVPIGSVMLYKTTPGWDVFSGYPEGWLVTNEAELKTAIADVAPGDIIIMQDQIWNNINIILKGVGTKTSPITLRAQTRGGVILSGSSSLRMSGEYLIVDGLHFKDGSTSLGHVIQFRDEKHVPANNSRLTNIAISAFNRMDGNSETWVSLFGVNNRVDHCLFDNKVSAGRNITVWRATDAENHHLIDHNYFRDVPVLGANGAEAIGVGASTTSMSNSYTTIEYNLFENCNGEGELIGLKSGKNIIRYNTILTSQGSISLRHGNDNLVEGNFILGGRVRNTGGIRIMGESHIIKNNYIQGLRGTRAALSIIEGIVDSPLHGYLQVKNISVEGNTLIDNETNVRIGDLYNPGNNQIMPVLNAALKDNVVIGMNSSVNLINVLDEPENMTYINNAVYIGILNVEDPGIRWGDPKMRLAADGLYYYQEDSQFKNNIIGQPLQKTEVGPVWLKDS